MDEFHLIDLPLAACVRDRNGCYRASNRAYRQLFNLPGEDDLASLDLRRVHPAALAESLLAVDKSAFTQEHKTTLAVELEIADGAQRCAVFLTHLTSAPPAVLSLYIPLYSAQKIPSTSPFFDYFWQLALDPMVISDPFGRVIMANLAYARLAGCLPHELVGKDFTAIFSPETRLQTLSAYQELFTIPGEIVGPLEVEALAPDGRLVHLEANGSFLCVNELRFALLTTFRDVTQRKQHEDSLRSSEERFRTIAEYTYDWEYWADPEGSFVYISPSVARITGHTAQEFYDNPRLIYEITHPDDRSIVYDLFQTSLISTWPLTVEFRIFTPNGEERWIDHVSMPVQDSRGRYLGRRASNRDHTRQKELQVSLRRQVEMEQIVAVISGLFLSGPTDELDQSIQKALLMIGEFTGADRAYILLLNPDHSLTNTHEWCAAGIEAQIARRQHLNLAEFPSIEISLREQRFIEIMDLRALDPQAQEALPDWLAHELRSILCVPLSTGAEAAGYIGLDAIRGVVHWKESDRLLLRLAGELVLSALARRRYEQELQRTSNQLSVILEGVADGITVLDASGKLVYANTAAARLMGLHSADELIADPAASQRFQITDTTGKPVQTGELPASMLLAGKSTPDRLLRYRPLDGSPESWLMVRSRPVLDASRKIQFAVSIIHDVTSLKQAEAALRASSLLYQTTVDAIDDHLLVVDRELRILLLNRAMRRWSEKKYPGQEPLGQTLLDAFPFLPEGVRHVYAQVFASGQPLITEVELALPDQGLSTETHLIPILENGQTARVITIVRDITLRRTEEERIQRQAKNAELLAGLSHTLAEAGLDDSAILRNLVEYLVLSTREACAVHIRRGSTIVVVASAHPDPELRGLYSRFQIPVEFADCYLPGPVFHSGELLFLRDSDPQLWAQVEPGMLQLLERLRLASILILPLHGRAGELTGSVFATLSLIRFHPSRPHSPEELAFYQDLANRTSLAVENARLYALQAQRARELDALNQVTASLLTTLNLDELLGRILDAARRAVPAAGEVELHLPAYDTGQLELYVTSATRDRRIKTLPAAQMEAYLQSALSARQAVQIGAQTSGESASPALLIAPLLSDKTVLGALTLTAGEKQGFSEADLRLLSALAAAATAALQNARLHAEVQRLAITDALTGLYNRRGLFEIGEREVVRAHRFQHPLAAIMLDLDDFKHTNDTFGHTCGDQVLRAVGACLTTNLRTVDVLGRYGGDEFVILLPETSLFIAADIANRLRDAVRELHVACEQAVIQPGISLGVTQVYEKTDHLEALLIQADRALYRAKACGKGCVEIG